MMRKIIFSLLILLLVCSCVPTEKLKYTINTENSPDKYNNYRSEKTIQPYDYLYIKIYSLDETTNKIFNGENLSSNQSEELISYSVNDKGYINFPFIGDIYVKDQTIDKAKIMIEKELNKYLTSVSLRLRFVGNKITVLGEVNRPGNLTYYDEKITIFQALGLAGDVANFGDKTKVTLIREIDNSISYHNVDLTKKEIVASNYYYMLPNDILIINPVKTKYKAMRNYDLLNLMFSSISAIATGLSAFTIYQSLK
jgi:polysaccharide export outer membrane protein